MVNRRFARVAAVVCGLAACAVIGISTASPAGAQDALPLSVAEMQTGLQTFFTGGNRSVQVTVTELGGPVTSLVRVVFYDAEDRPVFRGGGELRRGKPVRVEMPLALSSPRVLLRATVRIIGAVGRNSRPIMAMEDVDTLSLTIEPRVFCAPPLSRQGPVEPLCPDVVYSSFAVE